jgi:hypothetical protein
MPFGFPAPKNYLAFHIFTMSVPDECFFSQNTLISSIHLKMNDKNGTPYNEEKP